MPRPHLLFLSHRLPYPPHNGAAIRSFNILRLLARHYQVTALCFDRSDRATAHHSLEERIAALSHIGAFRAFPIEQERDRLRMVWDHARSLAGGRAYTYYVHESNRFTAALRETLERVSFELVHVDSLDLVHHLDALPERRTILTHHNAEALLLKRRADAERSYLRRAYLRLQAAKLAAEEQRWVSRVALNLVVSPQDQAVLEAEAGRGTFAVVPNGVDTDFFLPQSSVRHGIVFVGGTSYFPNLDALQWFESAVLPEIRRLGCSEPVTFVGRATKAEIARYSGRNGLELSGYVDDVRPSLDTAACFIAPLRVGGGTRLKLLDAWAMGKAVVSTTIGAEGLSAREGENILLRDTATTFAKAVVDIVQSPVLRMHLERGARQTAESTYSWNVIERDMIDRYEAVRGAANAETGAAVVRRT